MSEEKNLSKSKLKRYPVEFKQKLVEKIKNGGSVYKICREEGIGNSSVYKWLNDYSKYGLEGLIDKSTRPNHQPKKTSQWIIDKIIKLKKEKPEIGSSALSQHLKRFESIDLSSKTISKVFKKNELPDGDQGYQEQSHFVVGDKDKRLERNLESELDEWERFSRPNPNDLWQIDIMDFYIRDQHRVYLISALDDCSRMIINWGLFKQQTADNVEEVLRSALAKHGAPKEILTDQGAQFKHWKGVTTFEKLLAKLKIVHIKARSHHPQTCGKIEAFHKTIQRELIDKEFFISQEQAIEKIGRYIEHYNYARAHSSLNGFTPSDKYFGVIEAVKKYLKDFNQPKNSEEEINEPISLGAGSKLYLIGKLLGHDVRIQELSGQLSIFINNQLFKDINLSGKMSL